MSDRETTPLDESAYRRVRDATRTYREELVVRLAGEVGLRPREIAGLSLADVGTSEVDGSTHHLLGLSEDGVDRVAYVPDDLWDSLRKFARERGRDESTPVFDVSPRRIQMLVAGVGDRVEGHAVSSRGLRRSFARRALQDGVDPRVVKVAGGWASLDTVADVVDDPDEDAVVRAFGAHETRSAPGQSDVGGARRAVDAETAIGDRLDAAATRDDVETWACEALTEAGYDAALIYGTGGPTEETALRTAVGVPADRLDDDPVLAECADLSRETGRRVEVVAEASSVPGLTEAHRVAATPVEFGETVYGSLVVATDDRDAFDDRERRVLADLGRRLGQAIASVTRRRLLRGDAVVELEFRRSDERSFLIETARQRDCSFALEGVAPVSGESVVVYLRVSGSAPEPVVNRAADAAGVVKARLVRSAAEGGVVELVLEEDAFPVTLTRFGGNVTEYAVDPGGATATAEFPTDVDVRGVVDGVTAAFPEGVEFVAKREAAHPVSRDPLSDVASEQLTDRQRSVLRSAYLAGYFDWPRGTTAEELADALGISSPTLHNHLRKAQRTVLDELFDDRPT